MRILRLPNGYFTRVAYAGAQAVVTIDTQNRPYSTRLWDLAREAEPLELTLDQASLVRVLFKSGGDHFLRTQGVWTEGQPLPSIPKAGNVQGYLVVEESPKLEAFTFAPDGATVLYRQAGPIGGLYRTYFHVREPSGQIHALYKGECMFTTSAAFSPSGRLAAMSSGTKVVAVWDVKERREIIRLEQSDGVNALAFVSDDRLVVAAGRSVRLWDVNDGKSLSKYRAFRKFADALAVSRDRSLFAAGSRDGLIRLWDTETGREMKEYSWQVGEIRNVTFSPDGSTAAAAGISAVVVWDVD